MAARRDRAAVAERAARAGGAVAREAFRGPLDVETKANRNDLVTATDRAAQREVVGAIRQRYPDEAFVLEEEPDDGAPADTAAGPPRTVDAVPESGGAWIVDPIDGTANFVRGMVTWTTSVAAITDGETAGAATVLPALEDVYAAGPERVTRNGEPITVSERTDPATFAVGMTGWWDRTARSTFAELARGVIERFGNLRRLGSFQATLAHVADGGVEATVAPGPSHPWDTVAGVYMVRRAGGTVTDVHGDRWSPGAEGLVASNGTAHDAVLAATPTGGAG